MQAERVLIILGSVLAGMLVAQAEVAEVVEETTELEADTVEASLARQNWLLTQFGENPALAWLRPLREKRAEWFEEHGLEMAMSYHSLFQGSPQVGGQTSSGGDLTLGGKWALFGSKRGRPLNLHFRVRHRHAYESKAPAQLGDDLGSVWRTTRGFSNGGLEVPDFYFKQVYEKKNLELRYGQMVIDSQFDSHSLRGAKQSFLNQAFSSNPAVAFPRFGAGATLRWKGESGFDLTGGFSSVQGTQGGDQVDFDLGSGDFFEALQVGYNFEGWKGDGARVQALLWRTDAVDDSNLPEGKGFSVTLEQRLETERIRAFARYSHATGGATEVQNLIAFGIARDCKEADLLGVSIGVGQESGGRGDWQTAVECFYRYQVGPQLHVTPDLQILFGDALEGGGDLRLVFGVRGALSF